MPTFATFGEVLEHLKKAPNINTAYRENWNGKEQYICLQVPTETSKMTKPYIFITTVQGDLIPWLASQTDMLSDDWNLTRID